MFTFIPYSDTEHREQLHELNLEYVNWVSEKPRAVEVLLAIVLPIVLMYGLIFFSL
jgi:hypothetical protein